MVEGATSFEISNMNQMDENLFKEFLQKNLVLDYHSMSRDEYTTKSASEKVILIIKCYNEVYKGKSLYFIFLCVICSLALTFSNLVHGTFLTCCISFQNGSVVGF